jgi:O-antigen/teichoic acid export membrane protein
MKFANIPHTILYGFSLALMKGLSLIMLPFVAHTLSPDEFGRVEVLSSITIIASVIVGFGLEDSLYRFAGLARNVQRQRVMASAIFTLATLMSVISLLFLWLFVEQIQKHIPGNIPLEAIILGLCIVSFEAMIAVPLGWLRMNDQASEFCIATIGRAFIQVVLTLWFIQVSPTVTSIFAAGFIAVIIQLAYLIFWQCQTTKWIWLPKTFKKILIYSFPLLGTGLVGFALMGADRLFVAHYTSLEQVALYGVAAKFAIGVVLFLQPYTMWWVPKRFQTLVQPNGAHSVAQFTSFGLLYLAIATFMIMTTSEFLITLLMPVSYLDAMNCLLILACAMFAKEAAELLNIGAFTGRNTYEQFFINCIISLLGIGLLWSLVPLHGAYGAAISLCIAMSAKAIGIFLLSQKRLPLPFSYGLLFGTPIAIVILGVALHLYLSPLSQFIISVGSLFVIGLVTMWFRSTDAFSKYQLGKM